jgi:hypothetical protein
MRENIKWVFHCIGAGGYYLLTHGAEHFWRSSQFCSYSRIFPAFYGTRRFITVFTKALNCSLS